MKWINTYIQVWANIFTYILFNSARNKQFSTLRISQTDFAATMISKLASIIIIHLLILETESFTFEEDISLTLQQKILLDEVII